MKHTFGFFFTVMLLSMSLSSCDEASNIPSPGDNTYNFNLSETVDTSSCTAVSVATALRIIDNMDDNEKTTELYKISGTITVNNTSPDAVPGTYSNINFTLKDASTTKTIACWFTNNLYNRPFTESTQVPLVGSKVTVIGQLTHYVDNNGNYKPEMVNGFLCRIDSMVAPKEIDPISEPTGDTISVPKALEIAGKLASGSSTTEKYYVKGVIYQVGEFNSSYGNTTFYITNDNKNKLECYRTLGLNGSKLKSIDQTACGDVVVVYGKLKNYKGTLEMDQGGYIVSSTNPLLK